MRKEYAFLLMTLSLMLSALSPLLFVHNVAHGLPGPRMYLDPSDNVFYYNVTSIGHRFNVTAWVENATMDLGGAQIKLIFDDSIINVTRWFTVDEGEGGFMPSPISALPSPPNPGYTHVGPGEGYIKVAVSKGGLPPTAPWGHDGKICILEFEIIATPPEDGSLSSTLNIDNADTYLLDPTVSEIPDVTKEDGTYTFHYVSAPVLPHIWLEASPTSYQATKPRPFNVSINVQAVSAGDSLVGIQFVVGFNSTYLEVTEIMPGDFLSNPMWAPQGTQPTYYVDFRGVIYGELILPNMTGDYNPPFPSGNGTVATITFLPLLHQEADFNITVQPLFNTFFLDQHGDTLPYLSPQHCHYTYSPLPKPVLAVTPSTYIASHIGETFEIHINLENLDQRWKLTYAEFELQYGSDPLQVLNITEGDFLNQFGNVTFNYEHVNGSITADFTLMPSTHPQGDGTLLTITFNGTSSPGSSELTLNNTELLDFESQEIVYQVQHGHYQMHEMISHLILWETESFDVVTVSNASISPLVFNQTHRLLYFNATGAMNATAFINITIPRRLLYAPPSKWFVIVDGKQMEFTATETQTHTTLHIIFNLSTKTVYILGTEVVPEMPLSILILVLSLATLIALIGARTLSKKSGKPVHCRSSVP